MTFKNINPNFSTTISYKTKKNCALNFLNKSGRSSRATKS